MSHNGIAARVPPSIRSFGMSWDSPTVKYHLKPSRLCDDAGVFAAYPVLAHSPPKIGCYEMVS